MRVYRFLNDEWGLTAIKDKRLRISRIMDLNDPFEFLGMDLSKEVFREALQQTKRTLSSYTGVICFSHGWSNPLLWSHYADKHKGLCLGFDIHKSKLMEVNYVDERLPYKIPETKQDMMELLTTKFRHWEYEKEYRAFISLDVDIGGHHYIDFSANFKLRQIIVGASSTQTHFEIKQALGKKHNEVEILKARAAFRSFKVVRQHDSNLWPQNS